MNGAIIPVVLYYIASFQPAVPSQPLSLDGPFSKADCIRIEQHTSGVWCQAIRIKREGNVK
jgi:hypothetical protein